MKGRLNNQVYASKLHVIVRFIIIFALLLLPTSIWVAAKLVPMDQGKAAFVFPMFGVTILALNASLILNIIGFTIGSIQLIKSKFKLGWADCSLMLLSGLSLLGFVTLAVMEALERPY